LRKKLKHVRKGFQMGFTALRLINRVANPVNQAKFLETAIKGGGFILPESKYIGPGNSMSLGSPTSKYDALAMEHDFAYENYLSEGIPAIDVYTKYSKADEKLYKAAKGAAYKDPEAMALTMGMGLKKMAHDLGLTHSLD